MQNITLKELFMSAEELSALESEVAAGNFDAQLKLLLYHVYGPTPASAEDKAQSATATLTEKLTGASEKADTAVENATEIAGAVTNILNLFKK